MKEDILDKYALDQLNPTEKQWIQNALVEDPNFQEELDLHLNMVQALQQKGKQEETNQALQAKISQIDEALDQEGFFDKGIEKELIQGLQIEGEKELLQKIQHIDKNLEQDGFFKSKKSNNIIPFIRLFAAAASLIFIISFAWYYASSSAVNYQEEYAAAFEFYDNTLSKPVQLELSEQGFGGNPDEEALQDVLTAMKAYDDKDYQLAIPLLQESKKTLSLSSYQNKITLYLSLSYLESNEVEKAITELQYLVSQESSEQTVANWYLALAYLKTKQLQKVEIILTKLQKTKSSPYQKQATSLLQKIS